MAFWFVTYTYNGLNWRDYYLDQVIKMVKGFWGILETSKLSHIKYTEIKTTLDLATSIS